TSVGGDVDSTRLQSSFTLVLPLFEHDRLVASVNSQYLIYDFGEGALGEPWKDLHGEGLGFRYFHHIDDHWSLLFGGSRQSLMEDGADFGRSVPYGGGAGFRYTFSPDFNLGVMLAVASQLEQDVTYYPAVSFDWHIDKQWELSTEFTRGP